MKNKLIYCMLFVLSVAFQMQAQTATKKLPSVDIKKLTGEVFNTSGITNDGPIIISFWATWCKPCIMELAAMDENYIDWQEEYGVKVIAVSIDDARNMAKVRPFVNGKAWEFDIYLDPNSDFKRAMNVQNVPHSFILDKNGKIVWQHASFSPGDEMEMEEVLIELTKSEK